MGDLSTMFAAAGAAASWFGEPIGKEIFDMAKGAIKAEWQHFKWPEAEQRYRSRLRELYRFTRLLGNPKPIEIESIFTDVYILDQLSSIRRYSVEEMENSVRETRRFSSEKEKRIPLLRLAVQQKRLYLLGKPGAGKTTFLRYLTLQACAGKIQETPIYVELKDWVLSKLSLMDYLVRQFEICAFPDALALIKYLLEHGYALVLFDGLDEVNQEDEQRARMIRDLKDFANQYPDAHILLTCRIAASDYTFEQFTYLEIADFSDEQVKQFARKWYQDNGAKAERFLEEIDKPEHKGLKELTCTPILLALLCLAFDETLEFPQNRTELYEEALDALLKKWDSSRNIRRDTFYRSMAHNRRKSMLAEIAAKNFENNDYLMADRRLEDQIAEYLKRLPGGEAAEDIDSKAILKAIEAQHGLLIERARCIYSFSHLTFQEYLTALYIKENASSGTVKRLVQNHLTDDRWREVFLMTASLLPDAGQFFEIYLWSTRKWLKSDQMLSRIFQIAQPKFYNKDKIGHRYYLIAVNTIFAFALAGDLGRALARDLTLDRARADAFALADDLAGALALARARALDLDRALALAGAFDRAHALVGELAHALDRTLALAGDRARNLITILETILKQYFDIKLPTDQKDWAFDKQQLKNLYTYFYIYDLFLKCLDFATVEDREGIMARMLAPLED